MRGRADPEDFAVGPAVGRRRRAAPPRPSSGSAVVRRRLGNLARCDAEEIPIATIGDAFHIERFNIRAKSIRRAQRIDSSRGLICSVVPSVVLAALSSRGDAEDGGEVGSDRKLTDSEAFVNLLDAAPVATPPGASRSQVPRFAPAAGDRRQLPASTA